MSILFRIKYFSNFRILQGALILDPNSFRYESPIENLTIRFCCQSPLQQNDPTTNMGVATPWPKGAMAPPIICEKKFFKLFGVFFVLSCHLFAFYKF